MATLFEAIASLGPKLVYGRTAELDDLALLLSKRSGLSVLDIEMVLRELSGCVAHLARGGSPVRLPGFGRVRAAMTRTGRLRVHIVAEARLVRAINAAGYRGEVANRGRIGLADGGYKELWDALHPDDPLELPAARAGGRGAAASDAAADDATAIVVASRTM